MDIKKDDAVGLEVYEQVLGEPNQAPLIGLREMTIGHLFERVWSRPGLSLPNRRVITIALLAAQGHIQQLKKHIRGALKGGFSKEEILEIMIHVAHYAGWAAGTSGQEIAIEVLDEIELERNPQEQRLRRLNEEIGEQEKAANSTYFQKLLSDSFIFRRASGDIVDKPGYLHDLEEVSENPYEQLNTYVRDVAIDKESAVATILVLAKRKNMEHTGRFKNIRMFRRESSDWKLVAWINTREL
jgi:alkylhydroperoxidase/carboxymuconolactone decarboxylase family protein YurZ